MTTTVGAERPYILQANPQAILDANAEPGSNIREELGDLEELADSITESATGLIQFPVLVPREDGTMLLVAGFRRTTAAANKGLTELDFIVRADWAHLPLVEIKAAMIKENTLRKDLTVKEEADGYAQLMLFPGMTVERIVKATGRKRAYVEGQIALSKVHGDDAVALVNEGRLNPEVAAALEEFKDQPKIAARIVRKVGEYTNTGRWGGEHIVNEERTKRTAKQTAAQRIQELRQAGAVILPKKPKDFGYRSREADVDKLRDADGNTLDADKLVFQPGYAALLDSNGGFSKVRIVCLDPEAHGYKRHSYDQFIADDVMAEREQAAQEAAERAEAIAAAQEVRHKFLAETYGNTKSKTAKAALASALRQAAHNPSALSFYYGNWNSLVTAIAGTDPEAVDATTSADRVNRVMIARWVTMREVKLVNALRRGGKDTAAADWLDQLVAEGYELSGVERPGRSKLLGELPAEVEPRTTPDDDTKPCKHCGAEVGEWCEEECDLYGEYDADQEPATGDDADSDSAEQVPAEVDVTDDEADNQ